VSALLVFFAVLALLDGNIGWCLFFAWLAFILAD
jgi:hypothetical protein